MSKGKESKPANRFQELYLDTEGKQAKAEKMLLDEKRMRRKLQNSFDSMEENKLDSECTLNTLRRNLGNFDLNLIMEAKQQIEAAEFAQETIKEEYKSLFGEELA